MNRLRDDSGEDPVTERGIKLLRGTPSAPAETELKRRIWMALQQMDVRAPATLRMSKFSMAPRMRAFALAAVIVCVAGSAGAVIVGRWIEPERTDAAVPAGSVDLKAAKRKNTGRNTGRNTGKSAGKTTVTAAVEIGSSEKTIASREAAPPAASEPKLAPAVAPETRTPAAAKAPIGRSVGGIVGRPQRPSAPVSAPVSSGASLENMASVGAAGARERTEVLDALVALRRDRDPARAGALLDRYLAAHPDGALREEALVLAIEAADARGDHSAARRFARLYEQDHPKGRFRQFARSHL